MKWRLNNAWPAKIRSADFKSHGDAAVGALKKAHEQPELVNAN